LAPLTPVNCIVVVPSACASGVRTRSSPRSQNSLESFIRFSVDKRMRRCGSASTLGARGVPKAYSCKLLNIGILSYGRCPPCEQGMPWDWSWRILWCTGKLLVEDRSSTKVLVLHCYVITVINRGAFGDDEIAWCDTHDNMHPGYVQVPGFA
jgi:hypothetical protein